MGSPSLPAELDQLGALTHLYVEDNLLPTRFCPWTELAERLSLQR